MGTAPKDGTLIFGFFGRLGVRKIYWDIEESVWAEFGSEILLDSSDGPQCWIGLPGEAFSTMAAIPRAIVASKQGKVEVSK
jgi:hypothetical protein